MSQTIEETIRKATESPDVFYFGDFQNHEKIKSMPLDSPLVNLLNLFCYGVYGDHKRANIPELTQAQLRKLRCLTIISACDNQQRVSYESLLEKLELSSLRELEDLIIDLIYGGVLIGKMDQKKRMLIVDSLNGRDFKQDDLPQLKIALTAWVTKVNSTLEVLAGNVNRANEMKKDWLERKKTEFIKRNKANSTDNNKMEVDSVTDVDEPMDLGFEAGDPSPAQPSTSASEGIRLVLDRVQSNVRRTPKK